MTGSHPDIGPELRQLAQTILDRIDPVVRLAAAQAVCSGPGAGTCQQVGCPVCAFAALAEGERHPLLTVIAEHSVALLAVIRSLVEQTEDGPPFREPPPEGPPAPDSPDGGAPPPAAPGRYQHIPVTVEE
ncbi:MAG: hypothetical protein NVSMB60_19950 [Mycobacterium sp.]